MVFLRALIYILITPFHPMLGFEKYQNDSWSKGARRIAFWIPLALLFVMFYLMVGGKPEAFRENQFLSAYFFGMIKMGGIGLCLLVGGVAAASFGYSQQAFKIVTAVLAFTMLHEFLFIVLCYYFPEYYQEIRLSIYVWRGSIIVLGIYSLTDGVIKNAVIIGLIVTLILFFTNYNYFTPFDPRY
ncbi:MAG: hypothetical protein HUJ25_14665 [Crocinitomicaceae bacterium]|nr:hypothetical protein [Crocinitomicaceae bacterium]